MKNEQLAFVQPRRIPLRICKGPREQKMKGVIHRMTYKNFFQKAPTQQPILQKTVTRKWAASEI
jgi:hypothetical protein